MGRNRLNYIILIVIVLTFGFSCKNAESKQIQYDDKTEIQRDRVVNYAKQQIGVKYTYAGNSPKTGFDCSGFTKYVFSEFGYDVPRRSIDYESAGEKVSLNDCKKGDVLLFTGSDKRKRTTGHVGIVVSNTNGNISFVHASTSRGVVISDMKVSYYSERILGARRIIK
jgi:cell wall-associated NlpC family hydrolase